MGVAVCLFRAVMGSGDEASPTQIRPLSPTQGVHNVFALGTGIFSGSTPDGEEGFRCLATLGVKTIVSVDGAKPDVALARKYGMRYVHLPHGYDGISTNVQLQLAKAGAELPGPVYVHCHHGKHRGPAAAALICLNSHSWTHGQANAWLRLAGTATNYSGLYDVVRTFERQSPAELGRVVAEFPETAQVPGLVEAMVGIDERWEHLRAVQRAGYTAPPAHPDLEPANETLILREHYREAQRLPESLTRGDAFLGQLKRAEANAEHAESLLRKFAARGSPEIRQDLDKAFDTLARDCAACHRSYRDAVGAE